MANGEGLEVGILAVLVPRTGLDRNEAVRHLGAVEGAPGREDRLQGLDRVPWNHVGGRLHAHQRARGTVVGDPAHVVHVGVRERDRPAPEQFARRAPDVEADLPVRKVDRGLQAAHRARIHADPCEFEHSRRIAVESAAGGCDTGPPMGVRLNRIYTRSGDDGETGLGDGRRVPKHCARVAAYGTIDEASSVLGLARAHDGEGRFAGLLLEIQNDLFDLGSDLCVPGEAGDELRVPESYVTRLEAHIDRINADLEPLESFVLPGGDMLAAWLHVARTVARRAERLVTELASDANEADRVNPRVTKYLNRLSDLLFVMARAANDGGRADVLWVPGANARSAGADGSTDVRGVRDDPAD